MENKMMNLGRAKKKLRYFQADECTPCQVKVKDIFTVQDLDNLFDDIDSSEPGTPLLSPLPKNSGVEKQQIKSNLPKLIPSSPFDEEISPHKAPDCVSAELDVQTDHLNNKESPLGELAPIKTSSPIELFAVNVATKDAERPETSPLLFGMDEESLAQDLSKAPANPRTECSQDPNTEGSDILVSPPSRLVFAKPTRQEDVPVKSTTPKKTKATPAKSVHQIATHQEKLQHHRCDSPRISSKVIVQNDADALPESQPNSQSPEAAEPEMKEHSFKQKILNALQLRINRKSQSEMTVRVPSPSLLDDQFMIMEDDAPLRFVIPKKAEVNLREKPTPASSSAKLELPKASRSEMSRKHSEEAKDHKNRPAVIKTKTKATHGKTRNVNDVAQDEANEMTASIAQLKDKEQPLCINPETEQDDDSPGQQKTRRKNKVDQHVKKKLNDGASLPVIKPQKKKADKVTSDSINEKEEASSNVKKKNTKAKSSVKTGVTEKESIGMRKENKQDKTRKMAKHVKKQRVEQWQVENHCRTETPVKPTGSPETQSTCTVTESAIQPLTKPHLLNKTPLKVKIVKKKNEALKINTLSMPLPEVPTEASNKRRRNPPGEWWLTQLEHDTQTQPEESLGLQINQKSKKKASPVLRESVDEEIPKSLVENQNKIHNPSTVQKMKSVKKSRTKASKSHVTRKQTNRRTTGDKRNPKSRVSNHRRSTPRETSEEIEDSELPHELSPVVCSPLRQNSVTPGDKRVFSKIYTRVTPSASAQKCVTHEEPDLPKKRLRTSPKNFWEVPQSQQTTNLSSSQDSSPLRSRLMMPPPDAQPAVDKVFSSHKAVGRLKKKGQANLINTPKSAKSSLATFGAILASGKDRFLTVKQSEFSGKSRRNLLHSLDDQSQRSSENFQNSEQQSGTSHATFEICTSGVTTESFAARKSGCQILRGSNQMADDLSVNDEAMTMPEVEHFEEDNDNLPLSKTGPQNWHKPRVMSDCDLCGPPLKPVDLEAEDWDNLCLWLSYMWPPNSKNCQVISPDDFHWYGHSGRAMGHMIDLQNNTFTSGKILLGSFMKKPAQVDLDTVTVFNVASSCVRVEINAVEHVYNSGRTFLIPSGQSYSIHNLCREPAVLWYHRMLQIQTQDG